MAQTNSVTDVPQVYAAIAAVSKELAQAGIAKTRKNAQQGYQFRGIDEVLDALGPVLPKHGLVILPRVVSREMTERESKSGGTLFSVIVAAEFDFVAVADGSTHTVRTYGEAMDSADKATNKAMSAAYKYAAFQAFCIPTEGDNDADAHTPEPGKRIEQPAHDAGDGRQGSSRLISDPQRKRFYAIAKSHGWRDDEIKTLLKDTCGVERTDEIPLAQYDKLVARLEAGTEVAHG